MLSGSGEKRLLLGMQPGKRAECDEIGADIHCVPGGPAVCAKLLL